MTQSGSGLQPRRGARIAARAPLGGQRIVAMTGFGLAFGFTAAVVLGLVS